MCCFQLLDRSMHFIYSTPIQIVLHCVGGLKTPCTANLKEYLQVPIRVVRLHGVSSKAVRRQ